MSARWIKKETKPVTSFEPTVSRKPTKRPEERVFVPAKRQKSWSF